MTEYEKFPAPELPLDEIACKFMFTMDAQDYIDNVNIPDESGWPSKENVFLDTVNLENSIYCDAEQFRVIRRICEEIKKIHSRGTGVAFDAVKLRGLRNECVNMSRIFDIMLAEMREK